MGLVMDGCLSIENQIGHAKKWLRETTWAFFPMPMLPYIEV